MGYKHDVNMQPSIASRARSTFGRRSSVLERESKNFNILCGYNLFGIFIEVVKSEWDDLTIVYCKVTRINGIAIEPASQISHRIYKFDSEITEEEIRTLVRDAIKDDSGFEVNDMRLTGQRFADMRSKLSNLQKFT